MNNTLTVIYVARLRDSYFLDTYLLLVYAQANCKVFFTRSFVSDFTKRSILKQQQCSIQGSYQFGCKEVQHDLFLNAIMLVILVTLKLMLLPPTG